MAGNGRHRPTRPSIEVLQSASPEEAAAIAAAIEQFLRDTTPPPLSAVPALSPWVRAGLLEGTKRYRAAPSPWGDQVPWGNG